MVFHLYRVSFKVSLGFHLGSHARVSYEEFLSGFLWVSPRFFKVK